MAHSNKHKATAPHGAAATGGMAKRKVSRIALGSAPAKRGKVVIGNERQSKQATNPVEAVAAVDMAVVADTADSDSDTDGEAVAAAAVTDAVAAVVNATDTNTDSDADDVDAAASDAVAAADNAPDSDTYMNMNDEAVAAAAASDAVVAVDMEEATRADPGSALPIDVDEFPDDNKVELVSITIKVHPFAMKKYHREFSEVFEKLAMRDEAIAIGELYRERGKSVQVYKTVSTKPSSTTSSSGTGGSAADKTGMQIISIPPASAPVQKSAKVKGKEPAVPQATASRTSVSSMSTHTASASTSASTSGSRGTKTTVTRQVVNANRSLQQSQQQNQQQQTTSAGKTTAAAAATDEEEKPPSVTALVTQRIHKLNRRNGSSTKLIALVKNLLNVSRIDNIDIDKVDTTAVTTTRTAAADLEVV
ncbi:hypothetical protein GGI15_001403, partial [Coemansia interrupta]